MIAEKYNTEPTHISHALLEIMEGWKLRSNILTLNDNPPADNKLAEISDIMRIKKELLNYRHDKDLVEAPGLVFNELYEKTEEELEVMACELLSELNRWIKKTGIYPKK